MIKFTPGPWEYAKGVIWAPGARQTIASINEDIDGYFISAVPDMYEALKKIKEYRGYEWSEMGSQYERELISIIEQALAKADGK